MYVHIEKTNQKQIRKREKKLNLLYERTDLYKNLFAHDVKNIFQNIQSATDLCKFHLKKLDNYPRDSILIFEIIEEQIQRGRALAENVYKLSQVQKLNKPLERVDLVSLLKESSKNVLKSYPLKKILLDFESPLEGIYVLADNFLLDVFENVLTNAILHNDKTKIMIKIEIFGQDNPAEENIDIHILDNGPGINATIREKLFKGLITESKIGMGLGLFLVKLIIDNYEGNIWVEDNTDPEFGGGSKFTINLKKA
jgi:signal transduction histidine kinase